MSTKSASSIGLSWTEPDLDGGSEIIQYRVSYAINYGSYQVLANSPTTTFTAMSLTSGVTY